MFINGNNTPRIARIDLTTFETTEIIEVPNSAGNHSSAFVTENTEYVVAGTRFSVPFPQRDMPIEEYKGNFKGALSFISVNPEDGRMDLKFQMVTRYPRLAEAGIQDPRVQHMFRMACYDLDTFRRFVFETRFLKVFEVEEAAVEQIKKDDQALLELAFRWIRFGLVCGDVLPIREEVAENKRKAMGEASGVQENREDKEAKN